MLSLFVVMDFHFVGRIAEKRDTPLLDGIQMPGKGWSSMLVCSLEAVASTTRAR
jgi:hypothetical protein